MSDKQDEQRVSAANKPKGWLSKGKIIPFEKMSISHMKKAHYYAQRKELEYHNKSIFFSMLVDDLEAEAERRGITLPDMKCEYHKNNRKMKETKS